MESDAPHRQGRGLIIFASIVALLAIGGALYAVEGNPFAPPADATVGAGFLKKNVPPVTPADHLQGPADAPVTIVEYADLESPQTKTFDATMRQVLLSYPNQVAWVMRAFPIKELHPDSPVLALAAECAAAEGAPDAFWKFVEAVFAAEAPDGSFDMTGLTPLAERLGFDGKTFDNCIAVGTYAKRISQEFNDATAAGAVGAPFSVLITKSGTQVAALGAQPLENMKAAIDAALK